MLHAEARGFLAALLWPLLRLAIPHALSQENGGLKKRSEEVARGGSKAGPKAD